MSNYPSFLSLFLPGQHVSTGDVGKSRPGREVGVIYTRGEERGSEIEKERRDMNPFLLSQDRRGINDR
jgi:hypothetical protein